MRAVLRKHMSEGQDVEREVRARMKNIAEGSREWGGRVHRLRDEISKKKVSSRRGAPRVTNPLAPKAK